MAVFSFLEPSSAKPSFHMILRIQVPRDAHTFVQVVKCYDPAMYEWYWRVTSFALISQCLGVSK